MDDIREQQETANEISEILSRPVGFDQDVDDVCQTNILYLREKN